MLDESEFIAIHQLYRLGTESSKLIDPNPDIINLHADDSAHRECFRPLREEYKRLTGMDCHENAIVHHRISLYGPPCKACGKPLRTPEAAYCAACGLRK